MSRILPQYFFLELDGTHYAGMQRSNIVVIDANLLLLRSLGAVGFECVSLCDDVLVLQQEQLLQARLVARDHSGDARARSHDFVPHGMDRLERVFCKEPDGAPAPRERWHVDLQHVQLERRVHRAQLALFIGARPAPPIDLDGCAKVLGARAQRLM